jgi:glutamine cyclotransferase
MNKLFLPMRARWATLASVLLMSGSAAVWQHTAANQHESTSAAQHIAPTQTSSPPTAPLAIAAPPIAAPAVAAPSPPSEAPSRRLGYKVVGTYAHDVRAFTEGLLWYNGVLYESTGLEGHSTLRRVAFPSGRILVQRVLPPSVFAEGLSLADNRLVQLTWTDGRAVIYDRATLKPEGEFAYQGEGWGLTFDGTDFVMSNGSDVLTFRDPKTFNPKRTIRVTLDGRPLTQLNELEWIEGEIWANVWRTDQIVQIDPQSGRVKSTLNLTGLLPHDARKGGEDVLNGIAYDAARKRIFITGKWWPKLFQIEVQ